jgi:hypothetical protein
VLSIVQQQPAPDRFGEARELLRLVEMGRPSVWVLCLAVLALLAVSLLAAGVFPLAGLLTGAVLSLALCHYGPSWWPGRR